MLNSSNTETGGSSLSDLPDSISKPLEDLKRIANGIYLPEPTAFTLRKIHENLVGAIASYLDDLATYDDIANGY